jgi:hypothetical protein
LRPVLDAEVGRLPARFREAFILCCLEGLTHEEAGRMLGIPGGTVASRLSRARERLRGRLVRRGVTLSAAIALLAAHEASAAVSTEVFNSLALAVTARATTTVLAAGPVSPRVAALTEGALKAMWMTKLKMTAAVVLAVGAIGFGAGVVLIGAAQPGPGNNPATTASAAANADAPLAANQAPAAAGPNRGAPPAGAARSADDKEKTKEAPILTIADAQDEADLMRARLEIKQAELVLAKTAADRANEDFTRGKGLYNSGAMSQGEFAALKGAVDTALSQVRIKEVELREPEIRLRQALRRLDTLRAEAAAPLAKPVQGKDPLSNPADAREVVELMEAQVAIQRARLVEAKLDVELATAMQNPELKMMKANPSLYSPQEIARAEAEVRRKTAQMQVREAELADAEVRLKHARRRAEDGSKAPNPVPDSARMEELQKKIDQLQKELEALKKR